MELSCEIVAGNFIQLLECEKLSKWNKTRLAFIASSTFTDTKAVRDVLVEDTLPRIREIGLRDGVNIVLVDMRFVHKNFPGRIF